MNILYFFTYGYSLKTWNESGQLNRELKHFEKLHEENNQIKFTLITYGIKDDLNMFDKDFIDIIPIYHYSKKSKYKIFDSSSNTNKLEKEILKLVLKRINYA